MVLRPGEAATAWLMFAYSFLVMTAYNIVKPITRSKAINDLGADNLPYILIAAALLIGSLMHVYGWGISRLPRRVVAAATQVGLALLLVVFWLLFRLDAAWVSGAFFVFGLVFGLLMVSQFWTLANALYDSRQAGRLFGFIGGGASLGGITGAGVTTFTVELVGSDNLTLVSAGVLLLCAATVLIIMRLQPAASHSPVIEEGWNPRDLEAFRLLRQSRHLRLIAMIVGVAALGAVFVEQQLNMAVGESITSIDEITHFLGKVTMYLSIAGFLVQVGLTSRLHRSFGLATALLLLPVALGASSLFILATGFVWASATARVLDTALRYTVDRTTREVLFLPLPTELTHRVKPFVDVTVDRLAKGIGAVMLLALIKPWGLDLTWQQLSYANLGIVAVWIGLARAAHREYLETFRRNLHARVVAPATVRFNVTDARTIELLVNELSATDEATVLYAIGMLETAGHTEALPEALLAHESGKVRARALLALAQAEFGQAESGQAESRLPAVRRLLADPDAEVRAAAVKALASLQRDFEGDHLRPHLDDPSPRVTAAAAVELAGSGRPDDEATAETALARLIADADNPERRRHAAAALSQIRNPAFGSLLVPLIYDADVSVAGEAIRSARTLGATSALLLPALVSRLGHRVLKQPAREALTDAGEAVVPLLAHVMADPQEHVWVRRHVPATLQEIPCQASIDALLGTLDDPDGFLRFKSIVAIERLQRARPDLQVPVPAIETRLLTEAERHCELLSLRYNLVERAPDCGNSLLLRALDDKLARSLDRMFRLIGLLYSWTDVAAARAAIEHGNPRQRADALEYLEQVMSAGVRKRVIPLLDEAPMSIRVRHAHLVAGTRPRDVPDTLVWLFHDIDPIVASAAVHFAGDRGLRDSLASDLDYLTASKATPPLVREAAIWVRSTSADVTVPVVELVNRLRSVPVFALVSIDELFRIAQRGRQQRYRAGTEVFRRGDPAEDVLFLLTGGIRAEGAGVSVIAAPATVNLAEALIGRPVEATVIVVEDAVGLTLGSDALLTLLSDHSAAARGLFRTLLGSYGTLDQEDSGPGAEVPAGAGAAPAELGLHLRRIPLFRSATAHHLKALVAASREVRLSEHSVLWDETREPALHYVLEGEVRVEGPGRPVVIAGPGRTIGAIETLTGTPLARRAVVSREGRSLRLDRQDLFDVLSDNLDLLQGVFASVLDSGRSVTPP